jgi:molybdenum cofactor cytidylyltransferase
MKNQSPTIKTAVLILAAGNSSRLGKPKQLLGIGNTTLLQHTLNETLKLSFPANALVLGAYQEGIRENLPQRGVHILDNRKWETGMASSIQLGLDWLINYHDPDQVLILLCDQPFINHILMEQLIEHKITSKKGIIGSAYGGTVGVPVLFDKKYFPELLALKGREGAKKLVKKFGEDVGLVSFPKGNIDIDTEEDYEAYLGEDWAYFDRKE